jgi:hypothetical protein
VPGRNGGTRWRPSSSEGQCYTVPGYLCPASFLDVIRVAAQVSIICHAWSGAVTLQLMRHDLSCHCYQGLMTLPCSEHCTLLGMLWLSTRAKKGLSQETFNSNWFSPESVRPGLWPEAAPLISQVFSHHSADCSFTACVLHRKCSTREGMMFTDLGWLFSMVLKLTSLWHNVHPWGKHKEILFFFFGGGQHWGLNSYLLGRCSYLLTHTTSPFLLWVFSR